MNAPLTPEQFAEIKAWLAWEYRCSAGVKLEAIVEDLVAEVERLQGELAKTQRACQTLGKVVDRQAVDICRITGVPMPESGDADFERAWSVAFEMADEIKRLRAQVAAVEALAKKWDGADRVGQHRWGALEPSADALRATLASWDGEQS